MKNQEKRGKFSSSVGFILAATGSAVGLGNLWKFPYVAGRSGGAVFVIIYIFFVFILGVPIMLGEMAIGRKTKLNPIGAYKAINKKYTVIGIIGVVCAFVILSYYSVIGGWVLKYITTYITGAQIVEPSSYFNTFISSSFEPIIWHLAFMAATCFIVIKGISGGIEKCSKIMLPALFILIIVIVIRSVTLEGGMAGIKYFLVPDWSDIDTFPKLGKVLIAAMGQVFFSLSLGMGAMITYGSYLSKDSHMQKAAVVVPILDTLFAVLAGLAILPAVFAFGFEPSAGPGLLFETLPKVFSSMPFGVIFGLLFFVLVFFAAITSSVSLLEVVTSYLIDNLHIKRKTAAIVVSMLMAVIGVFAALSFGVFGDVKLFGSTIFDSMTFLTDKVLMPVGGMLMCIFVGYIWGIDNAAEEISNGGVLTFKWKALFSIIMKYIAPALIMIIFISSFFA
ncbi:MAG: sodium-dependent transporter [Oscillospiraceae bacterium]